MPLNASRDTSERPPAADSMCGDGNLITAELPSSIPGRCDEAGRAPQRCQPGLDSGVRGSPERRREGEGYLALNLMDAT
jgi:hypothetical protein